MPPSRAPPSSWNDCTRTATKWFSTQPVVPWSLNADAMDSSWISPFAAAFPAALPEGLADALGAQPVETIWDGFNYLVRLREAEEVRRLRPQLDAIAQLPAAGVIVTAAGDGGYDCVSRYSLQRRASRKTR